MTEMGKYRRRHMLKRAAFARKLQKNAALFQGVGAYHRKDANPKIALMARSVIHQGTKVRLYGIRALAALHFLMLLRVYAWPLLGPGDVAHRKSSLRFVTSYQALEDKILALAQLTDPHLYEALMKKTSRWPAKR